MRAAAETEPEKSLPAVVDAFYNLEFDRALKFVNQVKADFPIHPAGHFYESIVHYQRMQMEHPRSEKTADLLTEALAHCVQSARKQSKEIPGLGHYYMGVCYGFQARMHVAAGNYLPAVKMARRGVKHLKKALELDGSLIDAYLGVGMYHYYMDRMPAAAKPFAYLLVGMWGDREKGLEQIEMVARDGGPAKMEARAALASIYASEEEKAWAKSEEILKDLMERYPGNPRFRLLRLYVAQRRQDWPLAMKLSDFKDGWLKKIDEEYREHTEILMRYRQAETLALSGRARELENRLEGLEEEARRFGIGDWLQILKANALDARHEREKALELYKQIKDEGAREAAKVYIKKPYPQVLAGPKPYRWPLVGLPQE